MKGNEIVGKSLEGVVALCIKKIISYFQFVCCILYLISGDQLTVLSVRCSVKNNGYTFSGQRPLSDRNIVLLFVRVSSSPILICSSPGRFPHPVPMLLWLGITASHK